MRTPDQPGDGLTQGWWEWLLVEVQRTPKKNQQSKEGRQLLEEGGDNIVGLIARLIAEKGLK